MGQFSCLRTHRAHHEISELFHHRHSIDVQIIHGVNIRNIFQKKIKKYEDTKYEDTKYILKKFFSFLS